MTIRDGYRLIPMHRGHAARLAICVLALAIVPATLQAQSAAPPTAAPVAVAPKGPLKLSLDANGPPVQATPDAPSTRPPRRLNTVIVHGQRDKLFDSDMRLARLISRLPSIGTDSAPSDDEFDDVMNYLTTPGDPNALPDEQQHLLQQQIQPMGGGQPGAMPHP